jgi:hypothetical protein
MYGTRDAGFFGYSHFTGGFPGGQAEYVRVPFGNVNLLPILDKLTTLPTNRPFIYRTSSRLATILSLTQASKRGTLLVSSKYHTCSDILASH